jgi:hypothetical protein
MYHDVSGYPPFWDLETIITKKKRIYLSHLPRKPITRERNAGGDAPNDLKRRAALAGALVLAHYDIPSLRASS